jgi:Uma2 family endonuclease
MNALVQIHPPFTSAEFYKMAEKGAFAGLRVELRRGVIQKMSPQHIPHAQMKADLQYALRAAVEAAGLSWLVLTEATVSFGDGFEPMPDIVVLDASLLTDPTRTINPAAVKLVVEVADSSLADDMGEKREDYARSGLREYWVADVQAGAVIRHAEPHGDRFTREEPSVLLTQPLVMLTRPEVVARV